MGGIMSEKPGTAQFSMAYRCPLEHEAEGDRFFANHAEWMRRTHPTEGDEALLHYTVSKQRDDDGVRFLLCETYATMAGAENHSRLAVIDQEEGGTQLADFHAFAAKCDTIGGRSEMLHTLW